MKIHHILILVFILSALSLSSCLSQQERAANKLMSEINQEIEKTKQIWKELKEIDQEININEEEIKKYYVDMRNSGSIWTIMQYI